MAPPPERHYATQRVTCRLALHTRNALNSRVPGDLKSWHSRCTLLANRRIGPRAYGEIRRIKGGIDVAASSKTGRKAVQMFHELFVELGRIEMRLERQPVAAQNAAPTDQTLSQLQARHSKVCRAMERLVA